MIRQQTVSRRLCLSAPYPTSKLAGPWRLAKVIEAEACVIS
jgi:hypothetical protein